MSIINTGSIPKALWPGVKSFHGTTYRDHPKVFTRIFNTVSSEKGYEEYVGTTGFGPARVKPQGESMEYDYLQQGFTTRIVNTTYALGYVVTMEEIQDNQYKQLVYSRAKMNARSMVLAKEQNMHLILNRAFNSTYKGADGVELCSTAHPTVTGLTYANKPAQDADLSEAALEDALISIRGMKDDRDLPIDVRVKCLVIPRQLNFTTHRILRSSGQAGTANNDTNAMRDMGSIPAVVESIYLTSPGAWFLVTDAGGSGEGLIYQERMAPQFAEDNDFDTKNFKAGTIERYGAGWDNPRCIWGVNGP